MRAGRRCPASTRRIPITGWPAPSTPPRRTPPSSSRRQLRGVRPGQPLRTAADRHWPQHPRRQFAGQCADGRRRAGRTASGRAILPRGQASSRSISAIRSRSRPGGAEPFPHARRALAPRHGSSAASAVAAGWCAALRTGWHDSVVPNETLFDHLRKGARQMRDPQDWNLRTGHGVIDCAATVASLPAVPGS